MRRLEDVLVTVRYLCMEEVEIFQDHIMLCLSDRYCRVSINAVIGCSYKLKRNAQYRSIE